MAKSSVLLFCFVLMQGVQVQANPKTYSQPAKDIQHIVFEINTTDTLNTSFSDIFKVPFEEEVRESHKLILSQHVVIIMELGSCSKIKVNPPACLSLPFKSITANRLKTVFLLI